MTPKHKWTFRSRFNRRAFGWRSTMPIKRIREAVSEIKKVARKDMCLAAEGAVILLEKLSPAIELVDSSSGAIGNEVNKAVDELVPIISRAAVDDARRDNGWRGCGRLLRMIIFRISNHWKNTGGNSESHQNGLPGGRMSLQIQSG